MFNTIPINVPKWEKFNPRTDRAKHSWFRLQNDFFTDQKIFMLSNTEKLLFIFFLCEASKAGRAAYELPLAFVAHFMKITEQEAIAGLAVLVEMGLIESRVGTESTPTGNRPVPECLTTDVTNERTDSSRLTPTGLQEIWNANRGILAKASAMGERRSRAASKALKENSDPEYWTYLVKALASSPWHTGKNERGWKADIDFLLQNGKHISLYDRFAAAATAKPKRQTLEEIDAEFNGGAHVAA